MTINWGAVIGWTLFGLIMFGIISGAVSLIILVRNNRKMKTALYDMRDLMQVAMSNTKVAADRAVEGVKESEKVKEKIDKLADQVAGDSSKFELPSLPPLPPTSSMAWAVACGLVLAAFTFTGAGIRETGETMPKQTTQATPGDELTRQAFRLMAVGSKDYKGAEPLLRSALASGGDRVNCLEGLVQCHAKLGRWSEAEESAALMAVVEMGTKKGAVRSLLWKGWILKEQGRLEESKTYLREAIRNGDPDAVDALAEVNGA